MLRKLLVAALFCVAFVGQADSQTTGSVVDYSFYLPATTSGYLYAGASTTDAAGNTYVAGTFPYIGNHSGETYTYQNGFFVSKHDPTGKQVFYSSFGGTTFPYFYGSVNGVAVDSKGRMYIVGAAGGAYGGGLPVTPNAYQSSGGGSFLAVVSADGSKLDYASYFSGPSGGGELSAVAVDSAGNAYVAGTSYGTVPTTPGAPYSTPFTNNQGFVAKFNPNAASGPASLVYSTYLGAPAAQVGNPGSGVDAVNAIAVDSEGYAYVTGNSADYWIYGEGQDYPTTPGAYRYNGRTPNNDVFVTKVNPTGTAFVYSALLGPGSGNAIALDSSNDVYVAGTVYEDDYPTTSGAYQTTYPSGFVTELNPAGSALVASTFLGGPDDSYVSGSTSVTPTHIALAPGCASKCAVYVAGHTNGSDLPLIDPVQGYVPGSTNSGFFMELAGGLDSALQSSYFASGSGFDAYQAVPGIGVDSTGDIYLVGDALPLQLPTTQTATGPTGEGFFAKIAPKSGAVLAVSPSSVTFPQQVVDVSTAQEGLPPQIVYLENLGSKAATISSIKASSTLFSQTNDCNGTVAAGGYCTLSLGYTASAASTTAAPQTGTITIASNASVNPVLHLAGTAINDRFIVSSCGGVSPCPGLAYADTVVGSGAAAQIVTLTNEGNVSVDFSAIASNLPDYGILTNCPVSSGSLGKGQSCEVSIQFHPTQVGLRSGTIAIPSAGTTANTINIAASGTGLLSPNSSSLVLLDKTLNFGSETVGATSGALTVTVFNNGSLPATVFLPTTSTSGDATGVSDYVISSNNCGDLLPRASCAIGVSFLPTAAGTRSGVLSIAASTTSTPLTSNLTGIGVAAKQELEFSPEAVTFPEQVIDVASGGKSVSVYNVGPSPVSIDRVLVSAGKYAITSTTCPQTTLPPAPLNGQYAGCSVTVAFSPTATGFETGTVTVVDTDGSQSVLSLAGTGVAQTGSILLGAGGLNFGTEPVGTTATAQDLYVTNVGNSPVTVTAVSASGDYSAGYSPQNNTCAAVPFILQPNGQCGYGIYFTPSKVANPDNGTFTLTTSAGARTANLTGVGEAASKAIVLTPSSTSSFNFGDVEIGQTVGAYPYAIRNSVTVSNVGTDPVTLSAFPTITGANASDFGIALASGDGACGGAGAILTPGGSCAVYLDFTPSAAGARKAVLTIADDATAGSGVQTVSLTGTGTATQPAYNFEPETLAFFPQALGTTSGGATVSFINDGTSPITISSIALQPAANFGHVQNYYGDCDEGPVGAGQSCLAAVSFTATTAGGVHGTMTLTDTNGKTYTVQLYGYGTPAVDSLYVTPVGLDFSSQPQLSTSGIQQFLIYNHSTLNASIGQTAGSNTIVGSSTSGAFKVTSDGCSNQGLRANNPYPCVIQVALAPTASTAVGAQTGSLKIPVTYGDGKTGSYTVSLSGTVVAPSDAAELSPTKLTFPDLPVNHTSAAQCIQLTNNGNLPLTVGALTSTNTGTNKPFAITGSGCGYYLCGGSLNAGASCNEEIEFEPTVAGTGISGSLSFPITYGNGKTTTLTTTYSGNAIAAKNSVVITPDSANLGSEVVGQSTNFIGFTVTNNGNQPVVFGPYSLTSAQPGTNFVRNNFDYNSCSNSSLAAGSSCTFNIAFTPQETGAISGTLTIADGAATGGPHKIALSGVGIAASQAIAVSQKTVNFGNQSVGTGSAAQAIYLSNQSAVNVNNFTYTLGGANASDFVLQANYCPSFLWASGITYGQTSCALYVSFNPAKTSLGARTATVTVAFSGSGSPITINLTGTGVPPTPAVTLFPTSLTYPLQNVGAKSATQSFSVYNTGSANLTITGVTSTNATEFPITSNGCAGKTIASRGSCLVGVAFDPSAAGARTGIIEIADNATGSPQKVTVNGTGRLVPEAALSSASLTFGSVDVGATSAKQVVTVSNPGTATLDIGGIAVEGGDPGDFAETTTCGKTLAVKADCTITVDFAPEAAGALSASIVITDNAGNAVDTEQTIAVTGTGVGVPEAAATPATVAFGSQTVKAKSAAKTITLANSGTAALTIASVKVGGADAGDFAIATNSCGASLAAGEDCTVTVTFTPAATGARSGTVTFTDNSGLKTGLTQAVSLTGTGVAASVERASPSAR